MDRRFDMAVFDQLPPAMREALRKCLCGWPAAMVRQVTPVQIANADRRVHQDAVRAGLVPEQTSFLVERRPGRLARGGRSR